MESAEKVSDLESAELSEVTSIADPALNKVLVALIAWQWIQELKQQQNKQELKQELKQDNNAKLQYKKKCLKPKYVTILN